MMPHDIRKVWTAGFVLLSMIAAAMMLTSFGLGCRGPYDAAWRTLDGVQKARTLTAQQLAQAAKLKHQDCIKAHGSKTTGFADCINKHREALKYWQQIARPAINAAVQITATAIQIAERIKTDPKVAWLVLIKPAICALSRSLRMFGHYLGDQGKSVLGILQTVEVVTCD